LANNFSNSLLPNAGFNGQPSLIDLDANLSLMDFRLYDNALGRFFGIDLLADQFTGQSPYHFAYNSPILFGDPSGLDPTDPPTGGGSSWGPEIIINVGGGGFTTPIPYFGNLYDQVGFYDLSNPFEDREILPEIIIDP